jgi:PBP1b-binding outer membrane lipoprotein LpoB
MKPLCFFAAMTGAPVLVLVAAGCSSTWPPAPEQTVQHAPADTATRTARTDHAVARAEPPQRPPSLSVGVSDPGTQLILPWFLADIVNAVNTRQSFGDLMHTMKGGL